MIKPIVYGPGFSPYVRMVRLALEEKGVPYDHVSLDMSTGEHKASAHLARHPFGRVPALAHDGQIVYETDAIIRYVDEAFPGPKLVPGNLGARTRSHQIALITHNYLSESLLHGILLTYYVADKEKGPDRAKIDAAIPEVEIGFAAIEKLMDNGGPFLMGDAISIADLTLMPLMAYFAQTPESAVLLSKYPRLAAWWQSVAQRKSLANTDPASGAR